MKLLTFSTLFPNQQQPNHGIFVETRLRKLVASGEVTSRVVAPVPWFPSTDPRFGKYALYAAVPAHEQRNGLEVIHPRYLTLPKIGMTVAPMLLAQGAKGAIGSLIDSGYDFDAIDAHYFYPDGVAAALLGRYFNKPVVITARGSDVNVFPAYRTARRMIQWSAGRAAGIITVSQSLKDRLIGLGVVPATITPLRNGVDLERFNPLDRDEVRARLGLSGYTLISVGHLIELKGHHLIIQALAKLPDVVLLIAGNGPDRAKLEALAQRLGVAERVRFLGALPQPELQQYFNAADLMVLASSREGWANVLLESMACGTPVVASAVGGSPEVVAAPEAGLLMSHYSSDGVVEAVQRLRDRNPDRAAVRRYAEGFGWDFTTRGQIDLFQKIIVDHAA